MIKAFGNKIIMLVLFLSFISLCSCKKVDEFNLEKYNDSFFSMIKEKCEGDTIKVSKLELYYYDDHYYYEINLHGDKRNFDYEWLFIYWYGDLDNFFSIKDPEQCEKYFPTDYYEFLKAKEYDESKIYTKDEIEEFLKKYQIKYEV